jgi:hypothetical protein
MAGQHQNDAEYESIFDDGNDDSIRKDGLSSLKPDNQPISAYYLDRMISLLDNLDRNIDNANQWWDAGSSYFRFWS